MELVDGGFEFLPVGLVTGVGSAAVVAAVSELCERPHQVTGFTDSFWHVNPRRHVRICTDTE